LKKVKFGHGGIFVLVFESEFGLPIPGVGFSAPLFSIPMHFDRVGVTGEVSSRLTFLEIDFQFACYSVIGP
jgi:hypothetical protein